MRITKEQLKQIIKEELDAVVGEGRYADEMEKIYGDDALRDRYYAENPPETKEEECNRRAEQADSEGRDPAAEWNACMDERRGGSY